MVFINLTSNFPRLYCCHCLVASVVLDSLWPYGLWPTRLLCPWGFSRQEYWSGLPCPPLGDLPNPGIEPRSLTLQADSLPSEPPGKPTNTGVGSLSILQGVFLTRELNQGLLHCRQILYQLSYQGSPFSLHLLHLLHWQAGSLPLVSPGKSWLNTLKWLGPMAWTSGWKGNCFCFFSP